MEYSSLEQSVIVTLVYYTSLEMPLSSFDVWRYRAVIDKSYRHVRLLNVVLCLEGLQESRVVSQCDGFWCLVGQERLFDVSALCRQESITKRCLLGRIGNVLLFVPFIRGIIVSGSLVYGNATPKSDLDILVIVKHGYLWTVRMFLSFVTYVLKRKRHGSKIANRVCLNHFVSDQFLQIEHESVYNAQTYTRWLPLVSSAYYRKLLQSNGAWISHYVVQHELFTTFSCWEVRKHWIFSWCRTIIVGFFEGVVRGFLGKGCEYLCERIQRWYMSSRKRADMPGRIVLTKKELEFHPDSFERHIVEHSNAQFVHYGLPISWEDSGLV